MAGRTQWGLGRLAWQRLNGWQHRDPRSAPQAPDDGDAALSALEDVRFLRGLLAVAEVNAVRVARKHDKPWSEIAAAAGVGRRAAEEQWGDVSDS